MKTRTRARQCEGKGQYPKQLAREIARRRSKVGNYHYYWCKFCGHFHVGHYGPSRKTRGHRR